MSDESGDSPSPGPRTGLMSPFVGSPLENINPLQNAVHAAPACLAPRPSLRRPRPQLMGSCDPAAAARSGGRISGGFPHGLHTVRCVRAPYAAAAAKHAQQPIAQPVANAPLSPPAPAGTSTPSTARTWRSTKPAPSPPPGTPASRARSCTACAAGRSMRHAGSPSRPLADACLPLPAASPLARRRAAPRCTRSWRWWRWAPPTWPPWPVSSRCCARWATPPSPSPCASSRCGGRWAAAAGRGGAHGLLLLLLPALLAADCWRACRAGGPADRRLQGAAAPGAAVLHDKGALGGLPAPSPPALMLSRPAARPPRPAPPRAAPGPAAARGSRSSGFKQRLSSDRRVARRGCNGPGDGLW